MRVPQPFPYQGSKRNLAPAILGFFPEGVGTLIEPFAGSAAITLAAASALLSGRTDCASLDYKAVVASATTPDLIYLDPPYQGVCGERDPRYLKAVLFDEFVEVLETLNSRGISYLVSYDGRTGDKVHGRQLPMHLSLHLVELEAGRSSQATLLGRNEVTIESLYLSPALTDRLHIRRRYPKRAAEQLALLGLPRELYARRHAAGSPRGHNVDRKGSRALREAQAKDHSASKAHSRLRERNHRAASPIIRAGLIQRGEFGLVHAVAQFSLLVSVTSRVARIWQSAFRNCEAPKSGRVSVPAKPIFIADPPWPRAVPAFRTGAVNFSV